MLKIICLTLLGICLGLGSVNLDIPDGWRFKALAVLWFFGGIFTVWLLQM